MTESVSDHYLGERGRAYETARQDDVHNPGYAVDFEYFRPYLRPEQIALDFGCGNGGILRHIQPIVARIDGVEVNPSARGIAEQSGSTIYSSLDAIPTECRYDVIVSNHVLEHVRDVCGTLEQLRGFLMPRGLLILKLPFDDANTPYQRTWNGDDIDHHLYTWTPRLLANLLRECGYQVQSCRLITSAWHPRLFFTAKFGLERFAYWTFGILKRRRQTFAVAINPNQ